MHNHPEEDEEARFEPVSPADRTSHRISETRIRPPLSRGNNNPLTFLSTFPYRTVESAASCQGPARCLVFRAAGFAGTLARRQTCLHQTRIEGQTTVRRQSVATPLSPRRRQSSAAGHGTPLRPRNSSVPASGPFKCRAQVQDQSSLLRARRRSSTHRGPHRGHQIFWLGRSRSNQTNRLGAKWSTVPCGFDDAQLDSRLLH
jgi:hypothetical protein